MELDQLMENKGEDSQRHTDSTIKEAEEISNRSKTSFIKCPTCNLPTFLSSDDSKAYCATCGEYFNYSKQKGGAKLRRIPKKNERKLLIAVITIALVLVVLFASGGLVYYLINKESGYISIHDVAKIRGLEVKRDVEVKKMPLSEYNEHTREMIDEEMREYLWELERFYKCMLVIDEDWNLVSMVENQSGAGILGFYDTETEELYIMGDLHSKIYINYILSHEFTHALQDQNFDLDDYMDVSTFDEYLARLCVIEGDAMITMEMWEEENMDSSDRLLIELESLTQMMRSISDFSYDGYNPVLSEISYYPYDGGMDFVKEIYTRDGWDGVNDLFTDKPPLSTEHIMHIEKYIDYEIPHQIHFDLDRDDLELKFTSGVGEKLLIELYPSLGGWGTDKNQVGWGGDQFYYYMGEGEFLSVFKTSWDTIEDNDDFYHAVDGDLNWTYEKDSDGIYLVRGNEMYIHQGEYETTIFYSSSDEIIDDMRG